MFDSSFYTFSEGPRQSECPGVGTELTGVLGEDSAKALKHPPLSSGLEIR